MKKRLFSMMTAFALVAGAMTSCQKDFTEDINKLQSDVNALSTQVSALDAQIKAGAVITSVTQSTTGVTVTLSNGQSFTITNGKDGVDGINGTNGTNGENGKDGEQGPAGTPGTVITIENGVWVIDGVPTEYKVSTEEVKVPFVNEDGLWVFYNEAGEEVVSNYRVTPVVAIENADGSYTLYVYDAEGNATEIKLPTAASAITSIRLAATATAGNPTVFTIKYAKFTKPSSWYGPKANSLPASNSKIYSTSTIDVRIDPVSAPAEEVVFYLTNTKNFSISNIKLHAVPESGDDPITYGSIATRANKGNGLYTLKCDQFVLSKNDATTFDNELVGTKVKANQTTNDNKVAFAVNANQTTRSAYGVVVGTLEAGNLTTITVARSQMPEATLVATDQNPNQQNITVTRDQVYTIVEGAYQAGLMYDMYFYIDPVAVQAYGIVTDDVNHTFKVTKNPDLITEADGFDIYVYTLDIKGAKKVGKIHVTLNSTIPVGLQYAPVTFNIANLVDTNPNNNGFAIDMATMKQALGSDLLQWAASVDLNNTAYTLHTKADCSDGNQLTGVNANALLFYQVDNYYYNATAANDLATILVYPKATTTPALTLKLDKQYYLKITFNTATPASAVNSIVIPVTFTAPTVAEQFSKKPEYVKDGVIEAYYYNTTKQIEVNRYFNSFDNTATLTLKTDDAAITSQYGETWSSSSLATIATRKITLTAGTIYGSWGSSLNQSATNGTEVGYGKVLTVNAAATKFAATDWAYSATADTKYSFTIKVMSPIYEGTVKPVAGSSIQISANSVTGFDVTDAMITGVDYNNNPYTVVPDVAGTPTMGASNTVDVWSHTQVKNVYVAKKGGTSNTFINGITWKGYNAADDINGAINITADPLPNQAETAIVVSVVDIWGYTKSVDVPVTILVN